jgi:DnaJ family protein C protein 11
MDLFIQIKKAYDILNDPQKRAIYDVLGMKGLKAEGWEVTHESNLYYKLFQFIPNR